MSMGDADIRWIQRFANYQKALGQLLEAVSLSETRPLSNLEAQGFIHAFEFTHELAWNTLKDFLEYHGAQSLYGLKDVTREAYKAGLIENGEVWMKMIQSRNLTSHTYEEATATDIQKVIVEKYASCFVLLQKKLADIQKDEV
jgi:nucleotidyltransferase substrate binding protein (TIGR01987 family)